MRIKKDNLLLSNTRSCGRTQEKHGMCNTLTYSTWKAMIQRCTNSNNPEYRRYGGRGITICKKWLNSFKAFFRDMEKRPPGFTIERINNDLGYFKDNCKWGTKTEQSRNCRISRNNTTGINGVSWDKFGERYRVSITVNYRYIYLGRFKTIEEAAMARREGEINYWK